MLYISACLSLWQVRQPSYCLRTQGLPFVQKSKINSDRLEKWIENKDLINENIYLIYLEIYYLFDVYTRPVQLQKIKFSTTRIFLKLKSSAEYTIYIAQKNCSS